jgi:hypothetical protein
MTINKLVIEKDGVNLVDLEGAELQEYNDRISANQTVIQAEEAEKTAQATLKASAKAKLIAGEALTEAEANTIVL